LGLPQVALDQLKDTHLKFATGTATVVDFEEAVDTIVGNGFVDYCS
jgi:hypothetical protein